MTDHPPFRALITDLVEIRKQNGLLKLFAIDAGFKLKTNRNKWMARRLAGQVGQVPILALIGRLHTLRKVDWDHAMIKKELYVAKILASQEHNIKTYLQIWVDRECNFRTRQIRADKPEATKLLISNLITLQNAFESKIATDAID